MTILDTLITDRTEADVALAEALGAKGIGGMTPAELAEYLAGLKGAYNAADLNRVEAAMNYVAERLRGYGHAVTLQAGRSWTAALIPTPAMLAPCLDNLATLRAVLPVPAGTPEVPPDMDGLTVQDANDIERILAQIGRLLDNMAAAFRHCGAAVCGGARLLVR